MPFITVHDLRMYFEIHGKGPRLLVISGTGGDLRRSPSIFEMPIAQHFEILAYDQRGLGQTSRPDIPYTMVDYADDANALLEAVEWDRCLVMGISKILGERRKSPPVPLITSNRGPLPRIS